MLLHTIQLPTLLPCYAIMFTDLLEGRAEVGVWVGAHDIRTEAQWTWSDGQPWFDGIKWANGITLVLV